MTLTVMCGSPSCGTSAPVERVANRIGAAKPVVDPFGASAQPAIAILGTAWSLA